MDDWRAAASPPAHSGHITTMRTRRDRPQGAWTAPDRGIARRGAGGGTADARDTTGTHDGQHTRAKKCSLRIFIFGRACDMTATPQDAPISHRAGTHFTSHLRARAARRAASRRRPTNRNGSRGLCANWQCVALADAPLHVSACARHEPPLHAAQPLRSPRRDDRDGSDEARAQKTVIRRW